MGRDGQLANCDPDGQKIDKARDTYGARCDAVCLEEGQLVVYKRAEKFYARVAEWRAFPLASLLTPIAKREGPPLAVPGAFCRAALHRSSSLCRAILQTSSSPWLVQRALPRRPRAAPRPRSSAPLLWKPFFTSWRRCPYPTAWDARSSRAALTRFDAASFIWRVRLHRPSPNGQGEARAQGEATPGATQR